MTGRFVLCRAAFALPLLASLVACNGQSASQATPAPGASTPKPLGQPSSASQTSSVGSEPQGDDQDQAAGDGISQAASPAPGQTSKQPPSAAGSPAASSSLSAAEAHTLDKLNQFRAKAGAPPLAVDKTLTAFAVEGNAAFAAGGAPHAHFKAGVKSLIKKGSSFCEASENQGVSKGKNTNTQIDNILNGMMDEGPGGGHHDNILNPDSTAVGISILIKDGKLWLTNDFGGEC